MGAPAGDEREVHAQLFCQTTRHAKRKCPFGGLIYTKSFLGVKSPPTLAPHAKFSAKLLTSNNSLTATATPNTSTDRIRVEETNGDSNKI